MELLGTDDGLPEQHAVQHECYCKQAARPRGQALGTARQRAPFTPRDEEVERDDGAVQYEPFGAQWHENLYHAPARPLFILPMLEQLTTRLARVVKTMRGRRA